MERIGAVAVRSGIASGSPVEQQAKAIIPLRERKLLPALFDRTTDREIPDRVVCGYDLHGGHPELRRALAPDERAALERRVAELRPAVASARAGDRDTLLDALLGVQPQGFDEETSMGLAASYLETLGRLPPWAVREACLMVRTSEAKLEAGQTVEQLLNATARGLVAPYERSLLKAQGLLDAQVTLPAPRRAPPAPCGRPPSGIMAPIKPWRDAPMPSDRRARLLADLEARKARNESRRRDEESAA